MADRPISDLIDELRRQGYNVHDFYKPIYKYVTVEAAKAILKNCSILFRTPSSFNDPFEFHPDLLDYSITLHEMRQRLVRELLANYSEMNIYDINQIIESTTLEQYVNARKKVSDFERENALLFCASEVMNKNLMWSHYAGQHSGFCIGIFMPPAVSKFLTLKVEYVDEIRPMKVIPLHEKDEEKALFKWMFTKSKDWAYEQEVRTILAERRYRETHNKFVEVVLTDAQIVEIYAGLRTKQSDIDEVISIIKERNYAIEKIGKMIMKRNCFDLDFFSIPIA